MAKVLRIPKEYEQHHVCDHCGTCSPLYDLGLAKWCPKCILNEGSFTAAIKRTREEWDSGREDRNAKNAKYQQDTNARNTTTLIKKYGFDPFEKDAPLTPLTLTPEIKNSIIAEGLYHGKDPVVIIESAEETITIDW